MPYRDTMRQLNQARGHQAKWLMAARGQLSSSEQVSYLGEVTFKKTISCSHGTAAASAAAAAAAAAVAAAQMAAAAVAAKKKLGNF